MVAMDTLRMCATLGLLAASIALPAQEQQDPGKLTETSFAKWRDIILPTREESAWLRIGWRDQFRTALRDAGRLDKPILLWAMNGHPLGCV
jgi:hypothetical protein